MQRPDHEFHVVHNEIQIDFNVPLPAEGDDEVLNDLLSHHAIEIIKDRIQRGQPLDGIPTAKITASRLGEQVAVTTLDLGEPDEVIEIEMPVLLPNGNASGYDPLARLGDGDGGNVLQLADKRASDDLAPVGTELRITAGVAAGLRSIGIDPETMTVAELGRGLLDMAGYQLSARADGTYVASGKGTSTFVSMVEHKSGEHPELSHKAIASFLFGFASARTERGLLITDKFGPYEIHKKERSNPDCYFVTRERLQAFVDSVALA